jgi:hypothetical protein
MKYINKNTGDSISESVYFQLSETAQSNFIASEDSVVKTHTIVETTSNNLSVGDAIGLVVLSPVILFKSLFG